MNWAALGFGALLGALLFWILVLSLAGRHRHTWGRWETVRCETCGKVETERL